MLSFITGHFYSIYPSLFRKLSPDLYTRERINTPDDDFLDLDWARVGSKKVAIISHGLEGSSYRHYAIGMAKTVNKIGYDALAWNFRFCSGEINKKMRMYHSGSIDDLETVIKHAISRGYEEVVLIGFSMGGNQTLMYLGKESENIPKQITKAIVFSVPCHLKSSSQKLMRRSNSIYMKRFLGYLGKKMEMKAVAYPDKIDISDYKKIKTFKQFDDRFTAPIHGFKDAEDYWKKCSSKLYIPSIEIPTLIVNALDDPFLAEECFPHQEVAGNKNVSMENPKFGGHVGFVLWNKENEYWSEKRVKEYLK